MTSDDSRHTPGQKWLAIVRTSGTAEFGAAFASHPVLNTSIMNGSCVGVDAIGVFFAATGGGMYDSLVFTNETEDRAKTYLEWEGKAFGKDVAGITIITRNEAGLIQSICLYHRPFEMVVQFSAELEKRTKGKFDPDMFKLGA
jgi:hypothetical protein